MLPKITLPTAEFEVPTTKDKLTFRPMRVAEEKLLLIAKESQTSTEIYKTIKQVLVNCLVTEYDFQKLSLVDVNYLYLKLRGISIGNKIPITYRDGEDEREYTINVDIDKVEIKWEKAETKIDIGTDSYISLKLPSIDTYLTDAFNNEEMTEPELVEELVMGCLDKYVEGKKSVDISKYTKEEVKEWLGSFDLKKYGQIKEFVNKLPTIYLEAAYENSKGTKREFKYRTLNDFFIFP